MEGEEEAFSRTEQQIRKQGGWKDYGTLERPRKEKPELSNCG